MTPAIDAFACNEVRLLVACLAYQIMHIARRILAKATGTGWSLRRLRERVLRASAPGQCSGPVLRASAPGQCSGPVLRASARLVISGRRMTLVLSSAAAPFCSKLWPGIIALHWADP